MHQSTALLPYHLFDPEAEFCVVERRLPHWSQAGAICFITWRTFDSMPNEVLDEWHGMRKRWLKDHGINPDDVAWRCHLQRLKPKLTSDFFSNLGNRWLDALDASHGACFLRQPVLAETVAKSLHHFDGSRYVLFDFVVMPNHVHILVAFPDEKAMLVHCESWKHFTATQINRHLLQRGRFWQQDGFDHLVRSQNQFDYLRRYIADNPAKACLRLGEYLHYSRALR